MSMSVNLFQKYGGFAAISKIVMAFYDKAIDSDVIGGYFEDVDMRRLVDHQTKFISTIMGGPASFSDDALRQAHSHLAIDPSAFAEMTSLLEATLLESGIEPGDVERIIAEIRAKSSFIVTSGGS